MSFYDVYQGQYGGGGRGVNNVFTGSRQQRGHGLGSFFTGLFRSALPYITKGARAVGKEALRAGINIIDDVGEYDMTFKDSLRNRMTESGKVLKRKATDKIKKIMEGSGYNALPRKRRRQSRRVGGRRRIKKTSVRKKRSRVTKHGGIRKLKAKKRHQRKKVKKVVKRRRRVQKKKAADIFS